MISELQEVPYHRGGSDWHRGDCWFIVESWYKNLGFDLKDRANIAPGPLGIFAGFQIKLDWFEVDQPENDDLVIMSSIVDRQKILAGHVGVFHNGNVLHSDQHIGCVYQPITSRQIANRITSFLRHSSRA